MLQATVEKYDKEFTDKIKDRSLMPPEMVWDAIKAVAKYLEISI